MTANDVIGKYLIAEQNVPLFAFPGGSQIGMVNTGLVVGPVYSWIEKNNKLYWQFDYTIPGTLQARTTPSIGQNFGSYQQLDLVAARLICQALLV